MRLHDLVDDGQSEPGAAFEVRLEGLEDLFGLLRRHAGSGIGKTDLPVVAQGFDGHGQRAAVLHGADRILTKIPEHLLDLVAVGEHPRLPHRKLPLDRDASLLRGHAVIHERERVFEQLDQISLVEVILLGAGVGQEVGDDAVQPLRFAGHDVEQPAVLFVHLGNAGKHADRAGNGSQRIADLVRDGGSQPADGGQAVLHAHFALQSADLGEIVERIDVAEVAALRHGQAATRTRTVLRNFVGASKRTSPCVCCDSTVGRGSRNSSMTGSQQLSRSALQKSLRRGVDQRNAPIETGGDQSAADGVNNIFVQRLQALERAARVFQLHAHLPQFCGQQARQIGDGQEGKQVDEDDCLQRLQCRDAWCSRKERLRSSSVPAPCRKE